MELKLIDIDKSYGKNHVLKGISFNVESGRPLAFLGRNGAGKSTTIKILMGVISKDAGKITLNGEDFSAKNFKIGYLPEERGMYQKVKILEQLVYFAKLKGYDPHAAKKSALELLDRVGLEEYANKKLEVLSKGNQQKVQIAQSLIGDPEIIIMDEPFSGLDPINSNLLRDLILERAGKDKLMFFSSHQMGYVDEICDDLAILNGGRVVVNGSIDGLKRKIAGNNVYIDLLNVDNVGVARDLNEKGFATSIKDEKIIVDLTDKNQAELLNAINEMGLKIDNYGIFKPTLSDIFVEYAR
ncbi:ATP-binding cassette domain-containing protein [uncultured Ezakiella sp.]|uniref:ABC transporter ATP-binding protein n=1 Tax=uncultured Ezakiella sp. TaxID=1637529 RepID=UPI0025DD9436|nr:ATP-binding cassette domain-containing protein [uncultured Ezakiella sp.]